jgi:hypothetical protein
MIKKHIIFNHDEAKQVHEICGISETEIHSIVEHLHEKLGSALDLSVEVENLYRSIVDQIETESTQKVIVTLLSLYYGFALREIMQRQGIDPDSLK